MLRRRSYFYGNEAKSPKAKIIKNTASDAYRGHGSAKCLMALLDVLERQHNHLIASHVRAIENAPVSFLLNVIDHVGKSTALVLTRRFSHIGNDILPPFRDTSGLWEEARCR